MVNAAVMALKEDACWHWHFCRQWIMTPVMTSRRLYIDEPRAPGSTFEYIHDGMSVEETIAFFGRLEEDVKRCEEEHPDRVRNEVFY